MMITKEFREIDGKDELFKEVMVFSDGHKLDDSQSRVNELITALEADKAMELCDRKDYIHNDRDLKLIRWNQKNLTQDRKTLDKFLKVFYEGDG